MTERARTVFLGTGAFAVPIIAAAAEHPLIDLVAAVTAPPRRGSRGKVIDPPVAVWAGERGLPMLRPERLRAPESVAEVRALLPDLLLLADYGQIVPLALLELPRHGALNVHPSLLPRHRGATPIPAAILAGDRETGVTLMQMDAGLDTGPIVAQWHYPVLGGETAPALEAALAELGARLLATTLPHLLAGMIEAVQQDEGGATLTRPLRRGDGLIDPRRSAADLERQVRAYQPWPGSFVEAGGDRIVIWRTTVGEPRGSHPVGGLIATPDGGLALGTSDALLHLDEVQPAGGRRMSGAELVRGRPTLIGRGIGLPADRDA